MWAILLWGGWNTTKLFFFLMFRGNNTFYSIILQLGSRTKLYKLGDENMATKFFKRVTNKENMWERGNKGQFLEGNKDPPGRPLLIQTCRKYFSGHALSESYILTLIHDIQCKMLHQSLSLSPQNTYKY